MYVIAISNEKGGVGKSTTALNIASAIAERGNRTLLIDFDPSFGLTTMLGKSALDFELSIRDVLDTTTPTTIREATQEAKHISSNLFFVPGHGDLSIIEQLRRGEIQWPYVLKKELDQVADAYDFAVIDCPPNVAFFPVNAYVAADFLLIPIQTEWIALTSLPKIGDVLAQIPEEDRPGGMLILPTMYDQRTKHAQEFIEELKKTHPDNVSNHQIKRTTGFADSTIIGKPFIQYAPEHEAAKAYRAVAEEIIKACRNDQP